VRHLNVAPGQRIDVVIEPDEVGVWAWHCHILSHAETRDGMFGMVTPRRKLACTSASSSPSTVEAGRAGLPHAEELARLTGCPIHLVRVINPADIPSPATYGLLVEASAFAEALAEEARVGREYLEETSASLSNEG
jgi:hypothetical protein